MKPPRFVLGAAALLPCLAAAATPAFAGLPDWAKAVVAASPGLPEGLAKEPYRALLTERATTVRPDGSLVVRRRVALQALRADARIESGSFPFGSNTKMLFQNAWHLPPNDKARAGYDEPLDVMLDTGFVTDQKRRHVGVRGVKKGSLVFFEFEAEVVPRILGWTENIYEGAPIVTARVILDLPAGWTVRTEWLRTPADLAGRLTAKPPVQGSKWIHWEWELHDVPLAEAETLGDPPRSLTPRLVLSLASPSGASQKASSLPDWKALALWYEDRTKSRRDVAPAVAEQSKKLLAAAGADFFGKVEAATIFVRDKVRYTDVDAGTGDYDPHPPAETLTKLYGDSQDKAILLGSLLAAAGISSYPALVNTLEPGTVSSSVPSLDSFNRFVCAVAIPQGGAVPERASRAIAKTGDLGELLILDPTYESLSPGAIVDFLAGRTIFVLAGERGCLAAMQEGDAGTHLIAHRLHVEIKPDRSVSLTDVLRFCGQPAANIRYRYNESATDRRRWLEDAVLKIWRSAAMKGYEADPSPPDGCMTETLSWDLPAGSEGLRPITVFPMASDGIDRFPLGRRKTAVVYPFPYTMRYETTIVGAPQGVALKPVPESHGEGWSVHLETSRTEGALSATWEMKRSRDRFEVSAFPELKKFWAAIDATVNANISVE